ncbi:MAG: CHAT domain-containing protein [Bacteroidetes bacterium]|nr:MAG: CHAT domain-containing protein [Bacteroidota bacterium]
MKKIIFLSPIFFFFFFNFLSEQSISWENLFKSAERNYHKGKYQEAIKSAKDNSKTIRKKYKDNPAYIAYMSLYEAKCLVAKSQFNTAIVIMNKIDKDFNSFADENAKATIVAKKGLIELQIGFLSKVETDISNYLLTKPTISPALMAELNFVSLMAQVYLERWDLIGQNYAKLLPELQKLSVEKKSKTVTKVDIQHRKNLYGLALSLGGKIEMLKGNYNKADSIFKINKKYIEKNTEPHIIAKYWDRVGDNFLDKEDFDKAVDSYKTGKGKINKKSFIAIEFLGKIAHTYNLEGEPNRAKSALGDMLELADGFGTENDSTIYHLNEMLLGAERDIKFENADRGRITTEKLLQISREKLPQYHPFRLRALDNLYQAYITKTPDVEKAKQKIEAVTQFAKDLYSEYSPAYLFRLLRKANFYLTFTDDFNIPKTIFTQSPEKKLFVERKETHKDFIEVTNIIVNYYEITDRYQEALPLLEKAAAISKIKFGEKHLHYGSQMSKLAEMQLKTGNYKKAEATMKLGMKAIRADANRKSREFAQALSSMAKIYATVGNYEEAEDALRDAEKIYDKLDIKDLSERGTSVEEMAFLYLRLGQFAYTEELLTQIIAEKEQKYGLQSRKLINPYNQLGNLFLVKGDYTEAEKNIKQAENIAKKIYGETSLKTCEVMMTMAKFYANIGDYKKADNYLQQILSIRKAQLGENHVEVGNVYIDLALVKLYENLETESADLIEKARKIMLENFDEKHPLYAEALKTQGEIFIESKKYDKSLEVLKIANQIWLDKLEKRNTNSAYVYRLMADVYVKQKKFSEARDFYEKSGKIYRKLLSEENPEFVRTESKMAQMFFITGDLKKANDLMEKTTTSYLNYIKLYFPALSEREKAKFWAKIQPDFEFFNSLAVKQAESRPELLDKMYNFRLATKALLLSSALKMRQRILNGKDKNLIDKFKKWLTKKEQLTNLLALSDEERQQAGVDLNKVQEEINQLEKELSEESEDFANAKEELDFDWEKIKDKLDKDECAIEVIRYRKFEEGFTDKIHYAFLSVSRETKRHPKLALIENGNELEGKYLKYYKNMMNYQQFDKYSYTQYWKPLQNIIGKAKIIYFSPDGVYNQINPEGFQIDEEKCVIDDLNVRFVSNTKDLLATLTRKERRKQRKNKKNQTENKVFSAVLFGNPSFYINENIVNKKVDALPGTKKEISEISTILTTKGWNIKIFEEKNALEYEIKNAQNPSVLHIATHGFFEEAIEETDMGIDKEILKDPMRRNGVLARGAGDLLDNNTDNFDVSEGILTAHEALSLYLDNTLVVLSACETGKGDVSVGEGVYGLQRAFLVAGASSVVMSLFRVDDNITERLMEKFYEKYDAKLDNKRQAFNDAQKEIKKEFKHPAFWAVFNMIGVN